MSVPTTAWTRAEFEAQLRAQGSAYHIHHPFQVWMNQGRLTPAQVQAWVANRYYYQISIPLKDAAILANCPDRAVRREWIHRITDHDGADGDEGGIERWVALGAAVGLEREELTSLRRVLPGVRFAVDAYVHFARSAPWQEAVAASLTELFATEIHRQRLASWPTSYPWIDARGLAYFKQRTQEAPRDVEHGLRLTLDHFTTRAGQERVLEILRFKLSILWSLLDALWIAHVGYGPDAPTPPSPALEHLSMAMPEGRIALARRYRFQWEPAQNAHVLLFPEGMVTLNPSAASILGLCDGTRDAAGLVAELERQFPGTKLGPDVVSFLEVAHGRGWIIGA